MELPSIASTLIATPVKCNTSGTLFFRLYKRGDIFGAPILSVDSDGKVGQVVLEPRSLKSDAIEHPELLKTLDYEPALGSLYAVALSEDGMGYVLRLSIEDGSLKAVMALPNGFTPRRISVFQSGALIVSGMRVDRSSPEHSTRKLATIHYDAQGRLIGDIALPGDVEPQSPEGQASQSDTEISTRTYLVGGEASIYMLRPAAKPILYSIDEGGEVSRAELWGPGAQYTPSNFQVSGSQGIVEFYGETRTDNVQDHIFVEYDLSTREPLTVSTIGADVPGAFACYDGKGTYTFLTSNQKHLALLKARVQ